MAAPYEDEAISFVAGVNNSGGYWVSVAARRLETCTTSRGRQYELDTVQTGEYHPTWDNRDGALTPGNTASPYYPNVLPYRPVRKRMQYPATANMLTPNQASSGQAPLVSGIDGPVAPGNTVDRVFGTYQNPVVTTSATAFEGTQVLQTTVPASPTSGAALIYMTGWTVVPGQPHTFSAYVRTPTGSVALQAIAAINWWDASLHLISQSLGTASTLPVASNTWTRITVTATPPSNAAGAWVGVIAGNSPSAGFTLQCDGAQLEYAAAATTYTQPGTWYYLFNGFIERWPQKWDANGLFHKTVPVMVDHFGYLSQTILKPPFYHDMLSLNPRFFYTFDPGQTAAYVSDLTRNRGPAPVTNSLYGAGTLTFGNQVNSTTKPSASNPAGGGFLGGASSVATFDNPVDPTSLRLAGTYIDLTRAPGYTLPIGDGTGWYTRIIAFRCPAIKANDQTIWGWNNPGYQFTADMDIQIAATTGHLRLYADITSTSAATGDWYFLVVRVNTTTGDITPNLNGVDQPNSPGTPSSVQTLQGNSDAVGLYWRPGPQNVSGGYTGDVAFVAEFAGYLSATQCTTLWTSFSNAWLGDSSAGRYNRILGWAGFGGKSNITTSPGTASMGPANDITQGGQQATIYAPVTGTDVQTALQNVTTTENGNHFVAADGTLTFQSRSVRYGVTTPSIVFGENQAGGEIPYEDDFALDFDLTRVGNDVQVTQFQNSAVYEATAPTSQTNYGTRTLTRTVNSSNSLECNDAAAYLAYTHGNPDLRTKTLRVHVTANPSRWGALLSLECGVKARVMRRDLAQTIQWDGFVEKIGWSIDYATNDVWLDLEMSPADLSAAWMLSAWHTTLTSSVTVTAKNSNTTFESGISPWTVAGGTVTQSATQVHSGSFAARIVPDGVTGTNYLISEQTAVTAGTTYAVKSWVWFTNAVTNNYFTGIAWFNSGGTYLSTSGTALSVPPQTWTPVNASFVAPAGAAFGAVQAVLQGTPASANVWYLDDAAITNAVTSITLNPIGSSSTLPVAAYIPNNGTGTTSTVPVGAYTTGLGTVAAPKIRLGAGTGTFEEVAVASYTCTGGSAVTNYAGSTVPGQVTGYTSVTLTLAAGLVNSYTAGTVVSEALPAGMTDPTGHDTDSNVGTTTIIGY